VIFRCELNFSGIDKPPADIAAMLYKLAVALLVLLVSWGIPPTWAVPVDEAPILTPQEQAFVRANPVYRREQ